MYEAHFALRTRPFSPHHGAGGFVSTEMLAAHRQRAENCLREGAGIVLVTGDRGIGKSAFCTDLAAGLENDLRTLHVSAAGVRDPLALYQSILHELDGNAPAATPTAARLLVLEAARSTRPAHAGMLLIVDDAHELGIDALNELRVLAAARQQDPPLVRLVLSGGLELEERLADPALDDVNQRIGCHVILEDLTQAESFDYIAARIAQAGGTLDEIFAADALAAVCEAGAGRPRCLNQLCDHSLLLAYVNEERPVSTATVLEALDDLKGLALPWNLSYRSPRAAACRASEGDPVPGDCTTAASPADIPELSNEVDPPLRSDAAGDNWWDDQEHMAVIEVGGDDEISVTHDTDSAPPEADPVPVNALSRSAGDDCAGCAAAGDTVEVSISDPYAALDRQTEMARRGAPVRLEPPAAPVWRPRPSVAGTLRPAPASDEAVEVRIAATVAELRTEVRSAIDADLQERVGDRHECSTAPEEWDVVQPEPEGWSSNDDDDQLEAADHPATAGMSGQADAGTTLRVTTPHEDGSELADVRPAPADVRPRRYAQLFSRLRWRRAMAADEGDQSLGLR